MLIPPCKTARRPRIWIIVVPHLAYPIGQRVVIAGVAVDREMMKSIRVFTDPLGDGWAQQEFSRRRYPVREGYERLSHHVPRWIKELVPLRIRAAERRSFDSVKHDRLPSNGITG